MKKLRLAVCLWLLTQPGCHWILGSLGAKTIEAAGCADHCNPSMCDTQASADGDYAN